MLSLKLTANKTLTELSLAKLAYSGSYSPSPLLKEVITTL